MLLKKKIIGTNVILIPYRKEHVPKYHEWMQSEELQKLTASEPLTLDEEYEMQDSWSQDANKCTFIILDKQKFQETSSETDAMIGDTNLFFIGAENACVAEIEIMIAEEMARGKHCGWEAVLLMLWFGQTRLAVKHFVAKVANDNVASIRLFEKLKFTETSRSIVFQEATMEKIVDHTWEKEIRDLLPTFEIVEDEYLL